MGENSGWVEGESDIYRCKFYVRSSNRQSSLPIQFPQTKTHSNTPDIQRPTPRLRPPPLRTRPLKELIHKRILLLVPLSRLRMYPQLTQLHDAILLLLPRLDANVLTDHDAAQPRTTTTTVVPRASPAAAPPLQHVIHADQLALARRVPLHRTAVAPTATAAAILRVMVTAAVRNDREPRFDASVA
ncbi:hypothetical protein BKA81DRAFT_361643 [Phyllosticta paracitricarpa]